MKTKPKRTKKYNPGRWLQVAVARNERRMDGVPLEQKRQVELAVGHHLAFDQLVKSQCSDGWYKLAGHFRVALELANSGIGREYAPEIKSAMRAMVSAHERFDAGDGLTVDDAGREAISVALAVHDAQLAMATREEIKTAAKAIVAEIGKLQDAYQYLAEAA